MFEDPKRSPLPRVKHISPLELAPDASQVNLTCAREGVRGIVMVGGSQCRGWYPDKPHPFAIEFSDGLNEFNALQFESPAEVVDIAPDGVRFIIRENHAAGKSTYWFVSQSHWGENSLADTLEQPGEGQVWCFDKQGQLGKREYNQSSLQVAEDGSIYKHTDFDLALSREQQMISIEKRKVQ